MSKKKPVSYIIRPVSPEAHLYRIELHIPQPNAEGQIVTLPAWIPGSYMIRDFAKNIVTLEASCRGKPVKAEKIDKQTWRCAPCKGELVLCYEVYAWDLSVRAAHLDTTHGYFNGTSVFLRPVGFESSPCQVEIRRPAGRGYAKWRVATTLPRGTAKPHGFGGYLAASYEELIDHPVEMGEFNLLRFKVEGVPHEIAITGKHKVDADRLCRDLAAICGYQAALFGKPLPIDRYLFQVMVTGDGYGGLEHNYSTSLICKRYDLPQPGMERISEEYRQFLGLCSHEYFHLWNVKRIRPERLISADLTTEVYTKLFWAFEGITSYYDDLALLCSGCIEVEGYLELLAQNITRIVRGSGRLKQSVTESSFDAWTKFYKQDENAPNAIVSYYGKGAIIALALDMILRQATTGEKSLDDLMRALWQRYGKTGKGVPEDGVERLAEELCGQELRGFFDLALRSTQELPLEELLKTVGVGLRLRAARSDEDKGGLRQSQGGDPQPRPVLGARINGDGGLPRLTAVFDGGAAQQAGLSAGDLILAVDGVRASPQNLERLIAAIPIGSEVTVHAFRRDELMQFELRPLLSPLDTCELWLLDEVDERQLAHRQAWLKISGQAES
jgi:predicted metalloprotease with PDZ domain